MKTDVAKKRNSKKVYLPVLPLRNLVALPKSIIPVIVGREFSIKAVNAAFEKDKQIFVTAQKASNIENPSFDDIFHCGTRSQILQCVRMPNGTLKLLVEGIVRAQVVKQVEGKEFLSVESKDVRPIHDKKDDNENIALWRNLYNLFKQYVGLNEKVSEDVLSLFNEVKDLDFLADTVAVQMHFLSFKKA